MKFEQPGGGVGLAPEKKKAQPKEFPEMMDEEDIDEAAAEPVPVRETKEEYKERVAQARKKAEESFSLPRLDRSEERQAMGVAAKPTFEVKGVAKPTGIRGFFKRLFG